MIDKVRFDNYIKVVSDRKNISLLSSLFFLILTVLVISYVSLDSNITNIVSMIFILGAEIVSVIKLITNNIKLSNLKRSANKYISA